MYYIGICDDEKAVCMQLADMVCAYDKRKNVGNNYTKNYASKLR